MAGKRKVHTKTDLSVPKVEHRFEAAGTLIIAPESLPPALTVVSFPPNTTNLRSFDFARFYGHGIDEITYALQRQIERFLAGQDGERAVTTVGAYATKGASFFLNYLMLRSAAFRRPISLGNINREVIEGYLRHLPESSLSRAGRKARYNCIKPVLLALGRRGLISIVRAGDEKTFPSNPFPNSARHVKGEKPLNRKERQAFTAAVKTAAMPIFDPDAEVTGELLAYGLLIVALHTGRNTTPLLEMTHDCLRPHPKENTQFLVLWKRRGHNTSKVALRADTGERGIEAMPGVKWPVVRLIERVIERAKPLRASAPEHLADRVWLYSSRSRKTPNTVTALTGSTLGDAIKKLVANYTLLDRNSKPLRINISRLRKTFGNRVFELLDGDLASTALALGNTPQVADRHYLVPGEDSQRNWKFLGEVLTQELLTRTLGATERTPAGGCSDPTNGQYAPKRDGKTCFDFLNCLRCRNYVVTGDDLYKLFSFYWRVLRERDRMDTRLWDKHYAHIPRLIERDVILVGLETKAFRQAAVDAARERARHDPHPYWRSDVIAPLDAFRQPQESA
ncbi:MAG: hypothetical protein DCF27_09450 [Lysobacteraceae bacterium]|nr:MAG: hypothetical protein DCF27_09450 [Xanthomonadaceae bacterium]